MSQRNPKHTKTGPGRKHSQGDGTDKTMKSKAAGSFGRGLRNAMARKQRDRIQGRGHHDEHGAYTLVGRKTAANGETIRRVWLAGISAQRTY